MNFEKFGKYLLLEKIATGGMAEVFLAKTLSSHGISKFVAIKRILPQFSNNSDFIKMFQDEALVSVNLNNSNLVTTIDFGTENNQFFIAMEFVNGKNLRQLLNELKKNNKTLKIEDCVYIIKEAALGLDYAHRCLDQNTGEPLHIIHRDMSPQNIMISFEGEIKVIDFGIAKKNDSEKEESQAGTLKGKFAYMSPEQALGDEIDEKTDIFALGIILWEILANDRLFVGSNEHHTLRKVRECQVQPIRKINPSVPVELEKILMKALAKDKNLRYFSAQAFAKDLNVFLNKNFSDYSNSELSKILSDLFKSSFLQFREKLIEYAKVEWSGENHQTELREKILSEEKNQQTQKDKKIIHELKTHDQDEHTKPKLPSSESLQELKSDFKNLKGFSSQQDIQLTKKNIKIYPNQIHPSQPLQTQTQRSLDSSSFVEMSLKVVIALALLYVGYLQFFSNPVERKIATDLQTKKEPSKPSQLSQVNVSISSDPDGAQIFINNKDSGEKTPAILSFPKNQSTKIEIIKDNFYSYITEIKPAEGQVVRATLQQKPNAGYLTLEADGNSQQIQIYINNKLLNEKLPLKKYALPSFNDIKIKIYNPYTKKEVQTTVRIEPNKETHLQLNTN